MRKFYALLAGFAISLVSISSANARTVTPDVANFTFTIDVPNNNVFFTNTSIIGSEPGYRRAFWNFGDGTTQMTGPLDNTQHHYQVAGTYNVCLRIYRYYTNTGDSMLMASVCKTLVIQAACSAEFVTLSVASNPLLKYFVAQPSHNQNKKPVQICWHFGDGRDTCITYSTTYTGAYGVSHQYAQPGNYNVCVSIVYDGGCQAYKCHTVEIIGNPDICGADFERLATPGTNPLLAYYKALPQHNNNRKPSRICWTFGEGGRGDTCINYTESYTGLYAISHQYLYPGLYQVCVQITYFGGCVASKCKAIQIGVPDSCSADFERLQPVPTSLSVYLKALPQHNNNRKPSRVCWTFGEGGRGDTCINYPETFTGQYIVFHNYLHPGQYQVCVNIRYYGGCEASKCRSIEVGNRPDTCGADFERLATNSNPLLAYYKALPQHNNNRKPSRICWTFGEGGRGDTCINYTESFTGQYAISHQYLYPGLYQVCVRITYFGGCVAEKCKPIQIGVPDSCGADFERIAGTGTTMSYFKALPQHNNNRKPSRICWTFGEGGRGDTCINYTESYTGLYAVYHQYLQPGQYQVCVTIRYYGGCEASKCKVIQNGIPDSCRADFERIPPTLNNLLRVYFRALPWHNNNKLPQRICWTFGEGGRGDTCINYPNPYSGQYVVVHEYLQPGSYNVCVNILYYGGCQADKCKAVQVGNRPDTCHADFERIPSPNTNPLLAYYKALPQHNNNRKPSRVCWTFGEGGRGDTCINYPETFTGQYVTSHTYLHPGLYQVCVRIEYYGGCQADKCKPIQIGAPDSCGADFERLQPVPTSLSVYLRALPQHNNNRKPSRICWTFGEGGRGDTCINYPENYTGQYIVSHLYLHPGQYQVCVNIRYYGGCEASKCKQIVVGTTQNSCSVTLFEITPSITSLVRGFMAIPSSTPPRRPVRVCWYFGDGHDTCIMITDTLPHPNFTITHTYPGPGTYHACVRILFDGGCLAENCREVVILGNPGTCGGYMTDSMIGPRAYRFRANSIHAPNDQVLGYHWTFGDGTSATGQTVTHTYTAAGTYQVCVIINTRLGCETRICKPLVVPGGNQPTLTLTPNPVINIVHVYFLSTHTEQVNVKIFNSMGNPVRNYVRNVTAGPNNWTDDLTNLIPGVYSYTVQSPNQLASVAFIKL